MTPGIRIIIDSALPADTIKLVAGSQEVTITGIGPALNITREDVRPEPHSPTSVAYNQGFEHGKAEAAHEERERIITALATPIAHGGARLLAMNWDGATDHSELTEASEEQIRTALEPKP